MGCLRNEQKFIYNLCCTEQYTQLIVIWGRLVGEKGRGTGECMPTPTPIDECT